MSTHPIDIIANAIRVADGNHTMGAGQLAEVAMAALRPIVDDLDAEQGPSNFNEDNFEAGWHHALWELRDRLGLEQPK